jgi:hypothetical protein
MDAINRRLVPPLNHNLVIGIAGGFDLPGGTV